MKLSKISLALVAMGLSTHTFAAPSVTELEARIAALEAKLSDEATQTANRTALKVDALEDSQEKLGTKNFKISGYMDPTYIYTERQNRSGFQFLNQQWAGNTGVPTIPYESAFDNGNFGTVQLDFQKEMEGGTKFRFTIMPERGGMGNGISGTSIVHEASIYTPLNNSLYLFGGQIPSWEGYESAQANQTKLITHNLLFDFTSMSGTTGAGLNWINGAWTIKSMIGQISSSKNDSNGPSTPAVVARVDYIMSEFLSFGSTLTHGLYPNSYATANGGATPLTPMKTTLDTLEADMFYIKGNWNIGGQISVGQQKNAAMLAGKDAKWWGVSATATYTVMPGHEVTLRGDYLNNRTNGGGLPGATFSAVGTPDANSAVDGRNGLGTRECDFSGAGSCNGTGRWAVSFGYKYTINPNVAIKTEVRFDSADQAVFQDLKKGTWEKTNKLVGVSLVAGF